MFASSAPTTNSSGSSSSNEVYKDANAELGQRIASYAQKFIGVPYLLGGNGPKVFDCSGYTKYVYAYFGISIPRTAQTQGYWNQGQKIKSASALQVGDLVFFNTVLTDKDLCDHAGIYIGNNKVIHASSGSKHCVTISDMTSSYYKTRFSWGRRLI
jgi:cell wall-associated NlpC family hydrolase